MHCMSTVLESSRPCIHVLDQSRLSARAQRVLLSHHIYFRSGIGPGSGPRTAASRIRRHVEFVKEDSVDHSLSLSLPIYYF